MAKPRNSYYMIMTVLPDGSASAFEMIPGSQGKIQIRLKANNEAKIYGSFFVANSELNRYRRNERTNFKSGNRHRYFLRKVSLTELKKHKRWEKNILDSNFTKMVFGHKRF